MEVLYGILLALLAAALAAGAAYSLREQRRPRMFAQATVVAKCPCGAQVSFRLFDGEEIQLSVSKDLFRTLHVGDYGRLTYRAGTFISLER